MRTALLLGAASLAILSVPAHAAEVLYSSTGSRDASQRVEQGAVSQIALENGAIVSIVGPAEFVLRGEEIVIQRGGVTVAADANDTVMLRLPGNSRAQVRGSGSLTVDATGATGNVMRGRMEITSGGSSRTFATGQNWEAGLNDRPNRVFANAAQSTPQADVQRGPEQTVADAAADGIPITLGEALAGVGASGDVIAASRNVDAYLANPAFKALPRGDVAALLAFSDRLAAAYGGPTFTGASPAVVNAYLQFLADGGQIGAFQSAYAQLVSQYLTLLAQGGFASEFQGANLTALNAYLAYLQDTNALGQIGAGQQDLLTAYLAFLAEGGVPANFIAPANLLTQEAVAAYVAAISGYANFLGAGGDPADFGTSAAIIEAYLRNIAASGLLDDLFGAQAIVLNSYLEFLAAGGVPAEFDGFGPGGTISEALAAQYATAIQSYVAFLQGGGAAGEFQGGAGIITTYLRALQNAGLFSELLGAQATSLQAYLDFLAGGGAPGEFTGFGISAELAAQYATAVQTYVAFLQNGGAPADFTLAPAVIEAYLEALQENGFFADLLGANAGVLEAYLAFLDEGGNPGDFTGFGISETLAAQYAQSVQAYIAFLQNGGAPADFTVAPEVITAYLEALQENGFFAELLAGQTEAIEAYLAFLAGGGNPGDFDGFGISTELAQQYADAVQAYIAFLQNGGVPADFNLAPEVITAYLEALQENGLFADLLGGQATVLQAYLDFLAGGGNPGDFTGFGISQQLAAQYAEAVQAYVAFLQNGGAPGDFDLTPEVITAYLEALQENGLFTDLLGGQADALNAYLAFLDGGGDPADFTGFGLSQQLAQQYAAALQAFFAFVETGGVPSEFTGLSADLLEAYLAALAQFDLLDSVLAGQADFFAAYLAFLESGGGLDDFDQLPQPLNDAQKLAAIEGFITFIRADGNPSEFDGASLAALATYLDEFAVSNALFNSDELGRAFLNDYFRYLEFGQDPDAFSGLPVNGGTTRKLAGVYSLPRRDGAQTNIFGTVGANPVVLDKDGKFAISSGFSGIPLNGTVYPLREDAVYSELFTNDDLIVGRVTNVRVFNDGPAYTVGENQGAHYAMVPALPALPGEVTVDYGVTYATSPTFRDGSSAPGTFDADIRIQFGATGQARLATEGSIAMPTDTTYTFTTAGGLDGVAALPVTTFMNSPQIPLIQQTAITLDGTGKACLAGASCSLYMAAMPGGEGAQFLGVSYETRNGGEGAVTVQGAAGFAAGTAGGGGGGDGGLSTALAGENFDTASTASSIVYPFIRVGDPGTITRTSTVIGQVTRAADGTVTQIVRAPDDQMAFANLASALIDQRGDDRSLLMTYEAGAVGFFGTEETTLNPAVLATLSGPSTVLPVAGSVTYDLLYRTPAYSMDPALGEGLFDAQLAVTFGSVQRVGLEGSLTFDTTYTFSTPGGVASPEAGKFALAGPTFGLLPTLTGDGALCAQTSTCSLLLLGTFSDDYQRIATSFSTRGTTSLAYGGAIFGADTVPGLSFDSGPGETSGSLTAAFGNGPANIAFVDAGGLNRGQNNASQYLSGTSATFDDRGITKLTFSGTTILERGALSTADLAGTANWQVGRFNGGQLAGDGGGANGTIWGANNGYAYAAIQPFSGTLGATGQITYSLLGATRPTYADGSSAPGAFTGAMALDLATLRVGLEGAVTMTDGRYDFATTGGAADAANSQILLGANFRNFNTNLAVTPTDNGAACGGLGDGCNVRVVGAIGGETGSLANLSYLINSSNFANAPSVSGAAVFGGTLSGGPGSDLPEGTEVADHVVAYAATEVGIDTRNEARVIYSDTTLAPLAHQWELNEFTTENERPNIGTNTANESAGIESVAGRIGWSRWAGGETGGRYFDAPTIAIPENGGWHEVAGTPATNLPSSGTVQYQLIGSTNPTIRDGSLAPGSFSGDLAVAFGTTPTVGVELDVTIGGSSYAINTPGGVADPMAGGMPVSAGTVEFGTVFDQPVLVQGDGAVCSGSGDCRVDMRGFLSGDGAEYVGLVYTFGNTGFDTQVDGSAVFGLTPP